MKISLTCIKTKTELLFAQPKIFFNSQMYRVCISIYANTSSKQVFFFVRSFQTSWTHCWKCVACWIHYQYIFLPDSKNYSQPASLSTHSMLRENKKSENCRRLCEINSRFEIVGRRERNGERRRVFVLIKRFKFSTLTSDQSV